jgi:hypothetical protein
LTSLTSLTSLISLAATASTSVSDGFFLRPVDLDLVFKTFDFDLTGADFDLTFFKDLVLDDLALDDLAADLVAVLPLPLLDLDLVVTFAFACFLAGSVFLEVLVFAPLLFVATFFFDPDLV